MSAELILVALALLFFVAGMIPGWPSQYLHGVGGILLSVVLLIGLRA